MSDEKYMQLSLRLEPRQEQRVEIVSKLNDKVYDAIDYWLSMPPLSAEIKFQNKEYQVNYVLAPSSFIEIIFPGEKFGGYMGNLMFISSDNEVADKGWVPYIVFKLFAEKHVPTINEDEQVLEKHFRALTSTIRGAKAIMDNYQFREFIDSLIQHERSDYFVTLENELQNFLEGDNSFDGCGNDDFLKIKRKYLENHYHNKWVGKGRFDESMSEAGFSVFDGYRNHAEAIMSEIIDLNSKELYNFAKFVQVMKFAEPEQEIIIEAPYTAFAYAMTKAVNGKTNLVYFPYDSYELGDEKKDIIVKLPNKQKTWTALSKRLSFQMHKLEENLNVLIEEKKSSLDNLLIDIDEVNTKQTKKIEKTHQLISRKKIVFEDALQKIQDLSGDYSQELIKLGQNISATADNMKSLEELSEMLKRAI